MTIQGQEKRGFHSEVKQLLHLMIHSLYSNKEIFLRELISNASDAADKLRFCALSKPELYENNTNLRVRISIDNKNRTLTISDNGIGMTREEVVQNLGTIAKSGTKAFLDSMNADQAKNGNFIGQFGVGFYSAFIVSQKVTVLTRAAGMKVNDGVFWESTGESEYTLANCEKNDRGTDVILTFREGEDDFLDTWRVKNIINKYSDHLALPIEMEIKDEKSNQINWQMINKAQALWTRHKSEINDVEYKEFYKHITHDFNEPLTWSHNHVEGKQEYISLLYIPSRAPFDLWNRESHHGLKLYVQRVFIMDDAKQFIPNYLRFVRGLIDSNNLPLNVSREILQDSSITKNLRNTITKRCLQILEKLSKNDIEKYNQFWKEFGLVLKEGPGEDHVNQTLIATLLRFASTHSEQLGQTISLDDYLKRMVEGQDKIFYITSDSYSSAKSSPHLECFKKKGVEVLLLYDRIDEWMMSYLTEFKGKKFQSVRKIDESLSKFLDQEHKEKKEKEETTLQPLIDRIKKLLGDRVSDVRLTNRLTDTPAIVSTNANEMTTQMAKLLIAAGQEVPEIKYIFEINPEHKLIKRLCNVKDENDFSDWIELLLGQSLLAERNTLDDPNQFVRLINQLLTK